MTATFSVVSFDDLDVAGGGDLEVVPAAARALAGEALVEPRPVHAGRLGGVEDRDPAVGDLRCLGDVLGPLGAEPDRDVGAQGVNDRLERLAEADRTLTGVRKWVVRPVVGHRPLARQHLADDVDDLTGAGERLGERLAVPAFHHLRPAHAHAQDHPAVAEVVQGQGVHRDRGRRTPAHLHDRGAEPEALGLAAPPGQRRERVGAPRLGGEDRVEPGLLRGGDQLADACGRPAPQ